MKQGTARTAGPIALLAGEASGDILGAGLLRGLGERLPGIASEGVVGPLMRAAGCREVASIDELSVMGLAEVLRHLPRLVRLRRRLCRRWLASPPACFVGIDAPDFNLALEKRLRQNGIPTVHYVSPSVWAWRQGRVRQIARAVDMMLTLFPFEADFYHRHGVPVTFVGHPMADATPFDSDPAAARAALGLSGNRPIVALLPGSRIGEVSRLARPFAATADWLQRRERGVSFIAALANAQVGDVFQRCLASEFPQLPVTCFNGRSREVMAAADAVLVASGTATLEAMLLKRPMVVAYQVSPVSAWLVRQTGIIRIQRYSIPNLLMERAGYHDGFVDEFVQEQVTPAYLGPALLQVLRQPGIRRRQTERFMALHRQLVGDADRSAAGAVADLIGDCA